MTDSVLKAFEYSNAIGVFIYGDGGKIVHANRKFAEILGFESPEELIGRVFFQFVADNQVDEIKRAAKRRLKGEIFPAEYINVEVKTSNDEFRYIESFVYTVFIEDKPHGIVFIIDRTREKALEKLYRSLSEINQLIVRSENEEKLLKRACDILSDIYGYFAVGVGTVDEDKKVVSTLYARSQNRDVTELLSNLKIGLSEQGECNRSATFDAYTTGAVSYRNNVFEDPYLKCWYEYYVMFNIKSVCAIPIKKQGRVRYVFILGDKYTNSFNRDSVALLEELKSDISFALDNIELTKNSRLLSRAIEESHDWALITDEKGRIIYANKAVEKISGYSLSEIMGKTPAIFKSDYQDESVYKELWETIKSGKIYKGLFFNLAKDGSGFYLEKTVIPIIEDGKITRFVDLSKDITDNIRKRVQLEFQSRIYNTLFHVSNLSINSKSENEFLKNITKVFVDYLGVEISFIGLLENKLIKVYSKSAKNKELLDFVDFAESEFEKLLKNGLARFFPLQKSLKHGRVFIINDIAKFIVDKLKGKMSTEEMLAQVRELNINSCAAIPVVRGKRPIGSLVILSEIPELFDKKIYDLLNTIAAQIQFSLERFEREKFTQMALTAMDRGFEFIVITDSEFNIVYVNDKTLEISGYTREELIGKHHSIFSAGGYDKQFVKDFYARLKRGEVFSNIMKYKAKNGEIKDFFVNILPFKTDGKITNYISYGKEITDKEYLEEQLDKLLNYDSITGLPNVSSLTKQLNEYLKYFDLDKDIGALCVVNPINFKSVNEAFGFSEGNEVLKEIGFRIKNCLKESDFVARIESDRFGFILKNLDNELDVLLVIDRVLGELGKPYEVDNKKISLNFVIGLVLIPRDGTQANELLHKSRIALADARSKEDRKVGFFNRELEKKASSRLSLRLELENALRQEQFTLYYQPYVNAKGEVAGAESLLRWVKENTIVPTGEFIEHLEQMDVVVGVERKNLETIFKIFKKIYSKDLVEIPISINISKKSLSRMNLYAEIRRLSNLYGIEPKNVRIEIVERIFLENAEKIANFMRSLRELGVYFYLDDFGTGYSSLSHLSNMPIDVLKIDISFIRKIVKDRKVRSIVDSIIYLASKLGVKTVAEGVETQEQFKILTDMGCDYFQGYYFYKPMPEEGFLKLLSKK